MAAATSELWIYNTTASDIDIDELGITLPAEDAINIAHFNQNQIWNANALVAEVTSGNAGVVSDFSTSPPTVWPLESALSILQMGVNAYQIGLHKVLTPGIVDGRYYSAATSADAIVSNTVAAFSLFATPVAFMGQDFNRIGVEVLNPCANGIIHLGIYTNNNGTPGDLLVDAGFVSTDTVGEKEIVIDFESPMEWYWLCAVTNADVTCQTITASGLGTSVTGVMNSAVDFAVVNSTVFPTAFPAFEPDTWQNPPMIWLRHV